MRPRTSFSLKLLGHCRPRRFATTALPVIVILLIWQLVVPASAANARTASLLTPLSSGCISPSDCVSKMTLPEKEGQMTQVD